MQNLASKSMVSSDGFLLLGSLMDPIFVNPVARQILVYPQKPEMHKNLNSYLVGRIRSLFSEDPSNSSAIVPRIQSGRRTYLCRSFPVGGMTNGHSLASLAVLLERAPAKSVPLGRLYERFHLTVREQEVAQFLLQGLTSKEIGMRMQISPNTVKAFLRLIMVKMGVSTRSGIVGKALTIAL